ncbi:FUSC family protein [Anaerobranca gottschalkii]|nr:aromatic acid exporter family protein [Anaerobranca gottschalkii]
MRTIKTAIAVTLSVAVAYALNLNSPFFAAIAALITMQGNIIDSFRMGRDRILGTIIGAFIGMIFSYIALGNPIVIGFGVLVIIYISNIINFKKTIAISSVIFISIMLNFKSGSILNYGINMLVDTLVGIIIASFVNIIIYPHFSRDIVLNASLQLLGKCEEAIKHLVTGNCQICLDELSEEFELIEREYPTFKKEEENHLCKEGKIDLHNSRLLIHKLYHNIHIIADMGKNNKIDKDNARLLDKMYNLKVDYSEQLNNEEIVYNYHLKKSLELIITLAKAFNMEYQTKIKGNIKG